MGRGWYGSRSSTTTGGWGARVSTGRGLSPVAVLFYLFEFPCLGIWPFGSTYERFPTMHCTIRQVRACSLLVGTESLRAGYVVLLVPLVAQSQG